MKPTGFLRYLMVSFLLIFFASCNDEKTDDSGEPSNLVVEVTLPQSGTGVVQIQAQANNTIEYRLYIGTETQAAASNTSGAFEYTFSNPGTYMISVRAYGTSGRYIKADKQISISDDDPVTVGEGYVTPMQYDGYQLVWNDEFEGNALNSQNWSYETGAGGWGNNELQYYRQENTSVSGGVLTIEARKETYQNSPYTSSRLVTLGKKSFQYGRVDIRALLPEGQGIWPALWMLGNSIQTVGWPKCGETDIMEMIGGSGRENTVYGTLHWDNNNSHAQYGQSYTLPSGNFGDEYHVFSIIWDANKIKWYVNDIKYNEVDITPAHMTEFHEQFFFIFNIAVGGAWPGNPDGSTVFPQQMNVDYIRVFQAN
ncbi:MAG: glycoside hydrolase family 16 protein [Lentimicrobium sp.]|nr:glycoside hydrolase family 16 protein [Lentimicrobium sp.]HPG33131.1 glycoside hydrolase family 16 protein [Lentimicrobium sp.]